MTPIGPNSWPRLQIIASRLMNSLLTLTIQCMTDRQLYLLDTDQISLSSSHPSPHPPRGQPHQPAHQHQPGRVDFKAEEQRRGDDSQHGGQPVGDRGHAQLPGDARHQPQRGHIHPVQQGRGPRGAAHEGHNMAQHSHKAEGGQEDADSRQHCARHTGQNIAHKRSRRKDRPRCELADGDSVEELLVSQSAQTQHQIVAQKSEQHVAAAVEQRARFQKDQKQLIQAHGDQLGYDQGQAAQTGPRAAAP